MKNFILLNAVFLFSMSVFAETSTVAPKFTSSAVDNLLKAATGTNKNEESLTTFEIDAMKEGAALGIPVVDPKGLNYSERITYRELLINQIMIKKYQDLGVKFSQQEIDHLLGKIQLQGRYLGSEDFEYMVNFENNAKYADAKFRLRKAQQLGTVLRQRQINGFRQFVDSKLSALGQDAYSVSSTISQIASEARAQGNKDYNIYVLDWSKVAEDKREEVLAKYSSKMDAPAAQYSESSAGLR